MKKTILAQKVLASVLTIGLGGFVLPLAVHANSGLGDEPQEIKEFSVKYYYMGTNGAANNMVIIDSDLPDEEANGVIGGYAETGAAENNRVTVSGGTFKSIITGGYAASGNATDNVVNISGGTITGGLNGGYAAAVDGKVTGNIVNITGGTISSFKVSVSPGVDIPASGIYGGSADGEKSIVQGNSVNISGKAQLNDFYEGGFIGGGYASGANSQVTYNSVNISGGTINNSSISGGYAETGTAENNSVTVSGGTINNSNISGGDVFGSDDDDSRVTGNRVTISGGMIDGDVYGGQVNDNGSKCNVTGNSVTISGGMVKGEIYGGYVWNGGNDTAIKGNSITLSGMADVSEAALYGGYIRNGTGTIANNKLIINGWSGKVQSLNDFNGDNGGIEVQALAGGLDLAAGERTEFITSQAEINSTNNKLITTQATEMQAGVALTVSGEIGMGANNIYIDVASVRASDQTAITTESRAAAAAFVNQGAEAVSDSINGLQGADAGVSTFAAVSGNNSKYDTGSYVDINGWNGIVGVARTKDLSAGKLSYGAFFENGGGNYNTYNDFNGTSFRGDGNVVYNGGGLLMRYEQAGGVYTEASLRAGRAKNEVDNVLACGSSRYGFKTENPYYGAHIGIGKIFKLDNGKAWDIYGKYFHTHHEGDSVTIAGDVFDFDSVDSDKLRIGARFSEQQGEKLTSYYGLAWEYEFSGDAGGTANHYAMYTPSLEGSTVIGEVGFRYIPNKASPWYFDANIKGYAGMQEGFTGSVQAVYSF